MNQGRLLSGLVLALTVVLCAPTVALAQVDGDEPDGSGTDLLVTIAARECPTYTDIRANLARNNIMESLQDLGADTLYTSGEPVNPKKELQGQPRCRPIPGWQFTFGSGIQGRASTGPWGSLSIVTGADPEIAVTQDSTPLRGWDGGIVPGISIRGATTVELSQTQADRSSRGSLWIQGGTPDDPVLFDLPEFSGKYGFGALRCSIDDLNGDNVETIQFPTGTRHAFCYAYYVTPPPSSGTIVIRKEVRGSGNATQSFTFGGNLSYNADGNFTLSASQSSPGETTFYRAETGAGDDAWTVREQVPSGWALVELECEAEGGSQVTRSLAGRSAAIRLEAGDTVTCTYVNALRPPRGALLLGKVTRNGTGSFQFRVLDGGGQTVKQATVTTRREGVPAYARPMLLEPGSYRVLERVPADRRGTWRQVAASCNGQRQSGAAVRVTISQRRGAVCTFTNRLNFRGRIVIRKQAIGRTGRAGFQITSPGRPQLSLRQLARVRRPGVPATARGDASRNLPFGVYEIQESGVQVTRNGRWSLVQVVCNGRSIPFQQGRARVRLTERSPTARCRFVNLFTPDPTPGPPGPTPPGPTPPGPIPPGPSPDPALTPDLVVQKRLIRSTAAPVPTITFRITVTNRSRVAADDVVVTDQPGPGLVIVAAVPSTGTCMKTTQYVCMFGTLPPGGQVSVVVRAKDYSDSGTYNRATAGSASAEARVRNNGAVASVRAAERPAQPCLYRYSVAQISC